MAAGEQRDTWLLEEAPSTQNVAASAILDLDPSEWPLAVIAQSQTDGRGRFGRKWHSKPGSSLAVSLILPEYVDSQKPWLIGMAFALATAELFDLQLQWPNDLALGGRKVGGILTELASDNAGRRIPVVGVGLNLTPDAIHPEISAFATSIFQEGQEVPRVDRIVMEMIAMFSKLGEPKEWEDLSRKWLARDQTPGKRFILPNGQIAIAEAIGRQGELIARVDGQLVTVLAADAAWGFSSKSE